MTQKKIDSFQFREPKNSDGHDIHKLIERCPPLDTNSMYCNLVQCEHFSQTSVVVLNNDKIVAFTSGHIIPERPDTLFIWQVAVDFDFRGCGLGKQMLKHIVARNHLSQINYLETTITKDNTASWQLFKRFAASQNADLKSATLFDEAEHFKGQHDSEDLVRIGPFHPKAGKVDSIAAAKEPTNENI